MKVAIRQEPLSALSDYAYVPIAFSTTKVLKVESQNINPAACRFYAISGLHLGGLRPGVYPEYPDEVQLLWYLNLRSTSPSPSGPRQRE